MAADAPNGEPEQIPLGYELIQGDMIMPIRPASSPGRGIAANAVHGTNTWPDGRVPYEYDANLSGEDRTRIEKAMGHWTALVPAIRFVPSTSDDDSYVHLRKVTGDTNSSQVGRVGGRQFINLVSFDPTYEIEHELGHTLGLYHEQSRSDRDQYVTIQWDHIKDRDFADLNFQILPDAPAPEHYDFESLMHYGKEEGGKCCIPGLLGCLNVCDTITMKPGYEQYADAIGQRTRISSGDANAVRYLYRVRQELFLTLAGTGAGNVRSVPAGIACSTATSTCSADFLDGTHVTLEAAPAACGVFEGWSGACSGFGTCSVTMSSTRRVTAQFGRLANCTADQFGQPATAASPITRNDALYGESIDRDGDEDWFYFFGHEGQRVTIGVYADGVSPLIPQVAIKRSDGQTNEATATYARSNYARIVDHRLSRTGRFYVKIRGEGASTGKYVLEKPDILNRDVSVRGTPQDITDDPWLDFVNYPNDDDWYSFTVSATNRFRWVAEPRDSYGAGSFKLQMSLYNGTGNLIASGPDNEEPDVDLAYIARRLTPGTYRLRVRGYGDMVGYYNVAFTYDFATCAVPHVQPMSDVVVAQGAPLSLWAAVDGAEPLTVEWWTEGTEPALVASGRELSLPSLSSDASFRAIASNGCGIDSEVVHVQVVRPCDTPHVPLLQSPAHGAAAVAITPSFAWQAATAATHYELFVNGASQGVFSGTSTSQFTFPHSATLSWFVRAHSTCTFTDSPVWMFTTRPACDAPAIASQPKSRGAAAGTVVTLSVTASGTAPLSYQWYLGSGTGSPVGSNAPSLTVTAASGDRSYWVRLTNACGFTDSLVATVSIPRCDRPSFGPASSAVAGYAQRAVIAADFNEDGRPDIAAANRDGSVSVMLGTGAFLYAPATSYPLSLSPYDVATADFNGDGNLDLVVPRFDSLAVADSLALLPGDGTGRFGAPLYFNGGSAPDDVVVDDFNRDGRPDVAVSALLSASVSVLLGDPVAGLVPFTAFSTGYAPYSLAAVDVNGDGRLDLATANKWDNNVTIGIATASGAFQVAHYATVAGPEHVMAADFNGDGYGDVLAASDAGYAYLYTGAAGGIPQFAGQLALGGPTWAVTAGDVNGDTAPDVVAAVGEPGGLLSVTVATGDGSGGFSRSALFATHSPRGLALADVNGDGRADLLIAQEGQTAVAVHPNRCGALVPAVTAIAPNTGSTLGGTAVSIGGSGFAAGATVTIGGAALASMSVTPTSIAGVTAAGTAGARDVVVRNPDGQSGVLAAAFTYVARPVLVATALTDQLVDVTWSGSSSSGTFDLERSSRNGAFVHVARISGNAYSDGTVSPSTAYLYRVKATGTSDYSAADAAVTVMFTEDPLPVRGVIRAAHIYELRTAVNAIRTAVGLAPVTFEPVDVRGTRIAATHLVDLRTALQPAMNALGRTVSFTDASLTGAPVKRLHLEELRASAQ